MAVLLGGEKMLIKLKAFLYKNKKNLAHFFKFQIVGIINFFVDYGVLSLLNLGFGMPLIFANMISYTCGITNSFILNRYWTFKIKRRFFSVYFLKFIFVNLISLGVNTLAVYILADLYSLPNIGAKLIAAIFSFTVNFAGNKLLVFRDDENPYKEQTKDKKKQDTKDSPTNEQK